MRDEKQKGNLSVQAIAGTHIVLLGIDLREAKYQGLLGFALRREDHNKGEKYWLFGYTSTRAISGGSATLATASNPANAATLSLKRFLWCDLENWKFPFKTVSKDQPTSLYHYATHK